MKQAGGHDRQTRGAVGEEDAGRGAAGNSSHIDAEEDERHRAGHGRRWHQVVHDRNRPRRADSQDGPDAESDVKDRDQREAAEEHKNREAHGRQTGDEER